MITEKIELKLNPVKNAVFDFAGSEIVVQPYISYTEECVFCINYIKTYFQKSEYCGTEYSVLEAEYQLVLEMIDTLTNIKIADDEGNILIDIDQINSRQLWNKIIEHVVNYWDFRGHLLTMIENIKADKQLDSSFGKTFDKLPDLILHLFNNIKDIIGDDKEIEKLKDTLRDLEKEVENSPLKNLLSDTKKRTKKVSKNAG